MENNKVKEISLSVYKKYMKLIREVDFLIEKSSNKNANDIRAFLFKKVEFKKNKKS